MHGRNTSGRIRAGVLITLLAGLLTGPQTGCGKGESNSEDQSASNNGANNLATDADRPTLPHERAPQTYQIAGFEVIVAPAKLDIRRDGNTYWSHAGSDLYLLGKTLNDAATIALGSDITGDGLANLIIHESIDASHRYTILSLNQEIDVIAQLDAPESAGFRDFDGDGVLEFVTRDQTWADVLEDDAPRIVLRWTGTTYAASAKDLAQRAPRLEQLEPKIEQIVLADTWQTTGPPAELYAEALKLAYTGHEDLALRFIRWAWPEGQAGRDEFVTKFQTTLHSSPHYTQMSSEFASADGG